MQLPGKIPFTALNRTYQTYPAYRLQGRYASVCYQHERAKPLELDLRAERRLSRRTARSGSSAGGGRSTFVRFTGKRHCLNEGKTLGQEILSEAPWEQLVV
jgi:hypothetical protein